MVKKRNPRKPSRKQKKIQSSDSKSDNKLGKRPCPFISEDDYFEQKINQVREEHSKGNKFKLLGESYASSSDSDKVNSNVNNKYVEQSFINPQVINTISNAESSGKRQDPIYSRRRKRKKQTYNINSVNKQDHVNRGREKEISHHHHCEPLILELPCCYDSEYLNNQDEFNFENIIKEDIPDKTPLMKPRNLMDPIEDDVPGKRSLIKLRNEVQKGGYLKEIKSYLNNLSIVVWRRQPLSVKQPPSIPPSSAGHSHSNLLSYEFSKSTETFINNYESCVDSNDTNSENFSNDILHDNNNQYGNSFTKSLTPKSVRLLVLFIMFEYRLEEPNFDIIHSREYYYIVRRFENPTIDGRTAFQFVHDSIINCWANSLKVALVVFNNPGDYFLGKIREMFEEILDIIFVQPSQPFLGYFNHGFYVAKNSNKETWRQKFDEIMPKVILNAYRRNKYGGDEILFYNKDEPYYEFTNFYRAPIEIEYEIWPTTEHYFQAAKFENGRIREKIRHVYSAREAFTIARSNDSQKRKNWESPISPDNNVIFKENKMRNALMVKFTQLPKLKYKLLSTGKVKIFEHTENDRYWGDGGRNRDGLNRLGTMLQEIREIIMEEEKNKLIEKYNFHQSGKWAVPELREKLFDDLIDL